MLPEWTGVLLTLRGWSCRQSNMPKMWSSWNVDWSALAFFFQCEMNLFDNLCAHCLRPTEAAWQRHDALGTKKQGAGLQVVINSFRRGQMCTSADVIPRASVCIKLLLKIFVTTCSVCALLFFRHACSMTVVPLRWASRLTKASWFSD